MKTIAILPDVHAPMHHRPSWRAVVSWLAAHEVHEVIFLGDFVEFESVSRYSGAAWGRRLADDYSIGRQLLVEVRETVGPDCGITILEGNHETRLARFIERCAPAIDGLVSVPEGLGLDDLSARWVPEGKQPISRGKLDLLHGHQAGERLPKYHANRLVEVYGRPGHTVVYGHSHKPQAITRPGYTGLQRAVGLGCLRTLDPRWLRGANAGWAHEFAVANVLPSGTAHLQVIPIVRGSFIYAGELWGRR